MAKDTCSSDTGIDRDWDDLGGDSTLRIDSTDPPEDRDAALFATLNLEDEDAVRVETVEPGQSSAAPTVKKYSRGAEVDNSQFLLHRTERQRAESKPQLTHGRESAEDFANYEEKAAQARAVMPDFDAAVAQTAELPLYIQGAVAKLDNAAAMAYVLGKNPDFRRQLMEMPLGKVPGVLKRWAADLDSHFAKLAHEQNNHSGFSKVRDTQGRFRRK